MVQKREKSEKLLRIVMICAKEYLNKLVLVMIYIVKKLFIRNIHFQILQNYNYIKVHFYYKIGRFPIDQKSS